MAAAEVIDLTQRIYNKKSFTQSWQIRAWEMYEEIGEVSAAANYMGDAFSQLRLFIGMRSDDGDSVIQLDPEDPPEGFTTEQINRAQEILDNLNFPHSLSELQRMSGIALFMVGEIWLLGRENENGEEEWDTYSTEQITTNDRGEYCIKDLPSSKPIAINEDTDVLIHIWRRSPRFPKLATSSIKSTLTILEELLLLTLEVRATTSSRIPAGILALPDSLEVIRTDNTSDNSTTNAQSSEFLTDFMRHITTPIKEPGHASAVAPLVIKAHPDDIDKIKVIPFGRELSQQAMDQRKECKDRFASAINLPAEILTGKGGMNHWSAWYVGEETQNDFVAPAMSVVTNALTGMYLLPRLALEMEEVPPFVIGFERTALIDDPEKSKEDIELYDRFLISDAAMRKRRNVSEDDAPTPEEIAARILRKATVRETDSGGTAPPEIPKSEVASGNSHSLNLAISERELRIRLQTYADAAMHRALERSGAKLRSLAQKDKVAKAAIAASGIPNEYLCSQFPELLSSLGHDPEELLDSSFDDFGDKWDNQVSKAQLGLIGTLGLTPVQQQQAMGRFDQARAAAKPALLTAMAAKAHKLMFDPSLDAPELGEFEPDMTVSAGMIRNSLILAGGTAIAIDALRGPINNSNDPVSGLYSSDIAIDLYKESPNITIEDGFTWVHNYDGPHPFEPHDVLAGNSFTGENDDALVNGESFPDSDFFFPGDHEGCQCDTEPNVSFNE